MGLRSTGINLLETTLGPVVSLPFNQYDWPTPKVPFQFVRGIGQSFSFAPNILTGGIGGIYTIWPIIEAPYRETPRQPPANVLPLTTAPAPIPFNQMDWKVPLGLPTGVANWSLNFTDPTSPAEDQPFAQNDWPLAKSPTQRLCGFSQTSAFLTPAITTPFVQTDWPLPKAAQQSQAMRGTVWFFNPLTLQTGVGGLYTIWDKIDQPIRASLSQPPFNRLPLDTTPAAIPFVQSDWPTPKQPSRVDRGATGGSLSLNAAGAVKPFNQSDWPLPKVARPIEQTVARTSAFLTPSGSAFIQTDWPVPKGAVQPQRGFSQRSSFLVEPKVELLTMGRQFDMPAPLPFSTALRTIAQNLLETTLAPASALPFAFMGGQLPIQPQRTSAMSGMVSSFNPAILQASVGGVYTIWPLVEAAPPAVKSWTQNLLQSTLKPPVALLPFTSFMTALPLRGRAPLSIQYIPFNLSLNGIVTPVVLPDCFHLHPSTGVQGALGHDISTAGKAKTTASKAGNLKSGIVC
jgi:hypothetical protein